MIKVSIITATFNSASTISTCISSVNKQTWQDIEHIIIDGASNDVTISTIKLIPNRVHKIISEPDSGIYDAMNKGIAIASGDIIGILNSDDFYNYPDVIEKVVATFKNSEIQATIADVRFVEPNNLNKTVRYYSSKNFNIKKFRYGFMPAHPTFFTYRKYFDQFGYFKTDYKIAADFELLIRFLYKHKISYQYLPMDMIKMRTGGISTASFKSNMILNKEIVRACRENGIKTSLPLVYLKYFTKIFELIHTKE